MGVGVFPVHDQVCDHFPENPFAQADPRIAFHVKFIVQVLCGEFHEMLIGLDQVGLNDQAVIVAVGIYDADHGIDAVLGQELLNDVIPSEKQGRCQREAFRSVRKIKGIESRCHQQFTVIQRKPRMVGVVAADQVAGAVQQSLVEMIPA